MKTEKDLPYVLEDEFRGPNDIGVCQEFGEDFNANSGYYNLPSSSANEILRIIITGNYPVENADEEYFLIVNGINEYNCTKMARIKYTKPEYVSIKPYDCGKEELILTKEEKKLLNDFFKKEFCDNFMWRVFLLRTKEDLEGFTKAYLTEDIEQPNYLELPDERKDSKRKLP